MDGEHVVAVDFDAGHAVDGAAAGDARDCRPHTSNGTSVANWLFSQTNSTGSFQMLARFSPSWKAPLLTAPSPKNATATLLGLEQLEAVARPGRLQDARPDDAAGAHQADFRGEQVHAAAAAVRAAASPGRTARR